MIAALRRRVSGSYEVDPWGAEADWVDALSFAGRIAVRTTVTGEVPESGPAVVVASRRLGFGELLALVVGTRRATGRLIRPCGAPDVAPVGPLMRRLGVVGTHPAEVASLLRSGELVAMPLTGQWQTTRAGTIAPERLEPAVRLGVPIVPAAIWGGEISGAWRIVFGPPIAASGRATPLAVAELADRARAGVQALLDEELPPTWWAR